MAKTPIVGCFSTPLDGLLGTRSKIGVLRVISGAPTPLGYREVARRSGMAYRSIELAIKELVALGLLERIDGSRERLVRLSASHRLAPAVLALLRAEEDFRPALRAELRVLAEAGVSNGLMSIAIVGAAARDQERIGDPLKLLLLGNDPSIGARWRRHFEQMSPEISRRFGVRVEVVFQEPADAEKKGQLFRAAELLAGAPLATVIGDG